MAVFRQLFAKASISFFDYSEAAEARNWLASG